MAPLQRQIRILRQLDDLVQLRDASLQGRHHRTRERWGDGADAGRLDADSGVVQDDLEFRKLAQVAHQHRPPSRQ
jgi:hypothetical protein